MSEDTIDNNIPIDTDLSEAGEELWDPMMMSTVTGKYVKPDNINFSFFYTVKGGVQRTIGVKIHWNRENLGGDFDGTMDLHGEYKYTHSCEEVKPSSKDISAARDFFKKYKIIFAAVGEGYLNPDEVSVYLRGFLTLDELKDEFYDVPEDIFKDAKTIADIEKIVRENKLFDMND